MVMVRVEHAGRAGLFALCALAVAVVFITSGCISGQGPAPGGNGTVPCNGTDRLVQPGDTVTVQFTSRHTTGAIIETGSYTFVSMAGQARYGFDEAVEGMCLGQEKHVSVPPGKAYGERDESLVKTFPVESVTNRTFSVTREEFLEKFGREPVVGVIYEDDSILWPVRVGSASAGSVMLEKAVSVGYRIEAGKSGEAGQWPIDVTKVTAQAITLYRNVTDGQEVRTSSGDRTVSVSNGTITIDLNHRFAGETILYDIKVTALEKA